MEKKCNQTRTGAHLPERDEQCCGECKLCQPGKIFCGFFQNSQDPLAVSFRKYAAEHPSEICQEISNCPVKPCCRPEESIRLEDWLDNQDVMHILHISPRTLQTLRTNGMLPFSHIGNKLYYKRADIQRLLADNYTMIKIRSYGKRK